MVRKTQVVYYFIPKTEEERRKMFLLADAVLESKIRFVIGNEMLMYSDAGALLIIPKTEFHKYEQYKLIALTEADIDRELIQLTLENSKLY